MHVVELLPQSERERYARLREFLQGSVRQASIGYWNREEFPFELLADLGRHGFGRDP
jgi:glutaryl-CoA dehydrogenase